MLQMLLPRMRRKKRSRSLLSVSKLLKNDPNALFRLANQGVVKVWMNGKIYYRTPKGYLIPERDFIRNREKYLTMIAQGEL